jgi:hypothetical protein
MRTDAETEMARPRSFGAVGTMKTHYEINAIEIINSLSNFMRSGPMQNSDEHEHQLDRYFERSRE